MALWPSPSALDYRWNALVTSCCVVGLALESSREMATGSGEPVLVGAFQVEKWNSSPTGHTSARFHAIPRKRQQVAIRVDIDQMPVGGEWLLVEIVTTWPRWMILSEPTGIGARSFVSGEQGGQVEHCAELRGRQCQVEALSR